MNANRTIIASQVNAAFTLFISGQAVSDIIKNSAPVSYEYGLFAEQDIRVLMSMVYSLRTELVKLMDGRDQPLQDRPREGSLDANDAGLPDQQEVERQEAIRQVAHEMAVLERHLESLDEQARRDLEEAGQRAEDGGRVRFQRRNQQYRSYVNTWEEWLVDQKATTAVDSSWYRKLCRAEEDITIPLVSAQQASDEYLSYLQDDRLERSSRRAWDRVEESLLECGLEIDRHEKVMAKLNEDLQIVYEAYSKPAERKAKADLVKGQMAAETREHKEAINRPLWMLTKRLEPTALLAHTGAPKTLVDSPEWRTHEAQLLAAKARADAALAQAQMAEMNANMALIEANMNLMKIRKAMAEQQEAMTKQMKEMNDFMKPVKELKESKSKAPRTEKKAKAEKPTPKGANVLSTRGSFLAPTFRRGM